MNKKGEESSPGGNTVTLVIVIIVLVLVIIFLWFFFGGQAERIKSWLGFNNTQPKAVASEIFRYNISNDKLEYHDGTTWQPFKQGTTIDLNGKKIDDANKMKSEMIDSYISSFSQNDIISHSNEVPVISAGVLGTSKIKVKDLQNNYQIQDGDSNTKMGAFFHFDRVDNKWYSGGVNEKNLIATIVAETHSKYDYRFLEVAGYLYITPNELNSYKYLAGLLKKPEVYKISGFPFRWFYGLKNTVKISYKDKDNNVQYVETCFNRDDMKNYGNLAVNLAKPGSNCPYTSLT